MITVVIPMYNSENFILTAINSVLIQETEKELILIDDCSRDKTLKVVTDYLRQITRDKTEIKPKESEEKNCLLIWQGVADKTDVRIYKNEENIKVAETRNEGVRLAKGDYIAFLDADDWWQKGKLEKQLKRIEETGMVLCNTGRELVKEGGEKTGVVIPTPETITYKQILKTNVINCSSVLVKKSVLLENPLESGNIHEDYLAWLKILKEYGNACGINEPLMKYRLTADGKSRNKLNSARMTYRTYRHAGNGIIKAMLMMLPYTYYGIKKNLTREKKK